MGCSFPDYVPTTGYNKGCRCERCRGGATQAHQKYQARYPEKVKAYRAKNRTERVNRYNKKYPKKHKARWTVNNYKKSGKLVPQPCEVCSLEPAQAHHDDYEKPLDVRWLCVKHHTEHHQKERYS